MVASNVTENLKVSNEMLDNLISRKAGYKEKESLSYGMSQIISS